MKKSENKIKSPLYLREEACYHSSLVSYCIALALLLVLLYTGRYKNHYSSELFVILTLWALTLGKRGFRFGDKLIHQLTQLFRQWEEKKIKEVMKNPPSV